MQWLQRQIHLHRNKGHREEGGGRASTARYEDRLSNIKKSLVVSLQSIR